MTCSVDTGAGRPITCVPHEHVVRWRRRKTLQEQQSQYQNGRQMLHDSVGRHFFDNCLMATKCAFTEIRGAHLCSREHLRSRICKFNAAACSASQQPPGRCRWRCRWRCVRRCDRRCARRHLWGRDRRRARRRARRCARRCARGRTWGRTWWHARRSSWRRTWRRSWGRIWRRSWRRTWRRSWRETWWW